MASDAREGGRPERTLQDFATPELLHLMLSVVPTGLVAGLRDFTDRKEHAPGVCKAVLKRVPREASCSGMDQPASKRLSTLFWWSCPVLVLVNMPILAFVIFVLGPAVVLFATACIVPAGLLALAMLKLKEK
eukprot:3217636-Pyramimonas_sp.AAC.1